MASGYNSDTFDDADEKLAADLRHAIAEIEEQGWTDERHQGMAYGLVQASLLMHDWNQYVSQHRYTLYARDDMYDVWDETFIALSKRATLADVNP